MAGNRNHHTVVIAGGGPVGLLLALCLQREGIDCLVAERRKAPVDHSRSLGIHPVSLELFGELGIAGSFLREGLRIRRGHACDERRRLGTVSFQRCPPPYRFILAVPQYRTERLLEEHLRERAPGRLRRGLSLVDFSESGGQLRLRLKGDRGEEEHSCDFLAGCDGKRSTVREAAGFRFEGGPYGDSYLMGDFTDNTSFGTDAAVFLCREGLIESFPLPEERRRWVAKTESYLEQPRRSKLERIVRRRLGHDLEGEKHYMISSFGVQRYLSRPMARGRVLLAGDAAQVVSPIGGQGMNLGWLQARDLSRTLSKTLSDPSRREAHLEGYDSRRLRAARKAIRRAEFNMWLGRKSALAPLRNILVSAALHTPLSRFLARMFTMRGLNP